MPLHPPSCLQEQLLRRELSGVDEEGVGGGALQEEGGFHFGGDGDGDGDGGGSGGGGGRGGDAELTSPVMGAISEMQPAAALSVMSYMTLQVCGVCVCVCVCVCVWSGRCAFSCFHR